MLAAAGLRRLGLADRIAELLPLSDFPPACGQGIVAVECRADDRRMRDLLATIDHRETARALICERAFLAALDGSCHTPIAGHARSEERSFRFDGMLLSEDGRESYGAGLSGSPEDAEALGRAAGEEIRGNAPAAFLKRLGIG